MVRCWTVLGLGLRPILWFSLDWVGQRASVTVRVRVGTGLGLDL